MKLGEGTLDTASRFKSAPLEVDLSQGLGSASSLSSLLSEKLASAQKGIIQAIREKIPGMAQSKLWQPVPFLTLDTDEMDFGHFTYCGGDVDLTGLDIVQPAELPTLLLEVDLVHLSKTVESIVASSATFSSLLIDVHYSTLAIPQCRKTYLQYCASVGSNLSKVITFNIQDIPEGANAREVLGSLKDLRPYCRSCSIESQPMCPSPIGGNVSSLIWPYESVIAYAAVGEGLMERIAKIHEHSTKICVRGVPDADAATSLKGLNIDMIQLIPAMVPEQDFSPDDVIEI